MVEPQKHQQQTIVMIERTLRNLEHINSVASQEGLYEVTQLINSFASVAGQPWDRLLKRDKLSDLTLNDPDFSWCKFPEIKLHASSETEPDATLRSAFLNADQYMAFVRNAMAHGNFTLQNRLQFRKLSPDRRVPNVRENEIAGILLWNIPKAGRPRNREAVLSIHDMNQYLYAMQRFCGRHDYWQPNVLSEHQARQVALKLGSDPWHQEEAS